MPIDNNNTRSFVSSLGKKSTIIIFISALVASALSFLGDQNYLSTEQENISSNINDRGLDNVVVYLNATYTKFPAQFINVIATIVNASSSQPISDTLVILEAFVHDYRIFKYSDISNDKGQVITSFQSPTGDDVRITAKLLSDSNSPMALQVLPSTPSWSLFLILALISIAFAVIVFAPYTFLRFTIFIVVVIVVSGFIILYFFNPLNEIGTAVLSGALFTPIAAFMIDLVKKRSEVNSIREESVGNYIRETLQQEIISIVNIHDEIRQHSAILKAKHIVEGKELSTKMFNESKKTGTMANFPTRRIYRYYYYVDTINKLLKAKSFPTGDLRIDRNYKIFCTLLDQLRAEFLELNDILYRNVLYNIGEIQNRFLSFPTVEFPSRISGPLRDTLDTLKIISIDREIRDKIKGIFYKRKQIEEELKEFSSNEKKVEKDKLQHEELQLRREKIKRENRQLRPNTIYSQLNSDLIMSLIDNEYDRMYEKIEKTLDKIFEYDLIDKENIGSIDETELSLIIINSNDPKRIAEEIALLSSIANYNLIQGNKVEFKDVYFDIGDLLQKDNISLRIRTICDKEPKKITLKGPTILNKDGIFQRLEFEEQYSKASVATVLDKLREMGIKIPETKNGLSDHEPLKQYGFIPIQERKTVRKIKNIIQINHKLSQIAELAIDFVSYDFPLNSTVHYYNIEIELKARENLPDINNIAQILIRKYPLKIWKHSKFATGKAIRELLIEDKLNALVDDKCILKPIAYNKINEIIFEKNL